MSGGFAATVFELFVVASSMSLLFTNLAVSLTFVPNHFNPPNQNVCSNVISQCGEAWEDPVFLYYLMKCFIPFLLFYYHHTSSSTFM